MSHHESKRDIFFRIRAEDAKNLFPIYIHGFFVKSLTGISIQDFLIGNVGIARDYIERRITTVFVNGAPVDDMGTSFIEDGMVLALSSAMPGLAGATLRRKGYLSSMRNSITRKVNNYPAGVHSECSLQVKLFNILAREIGPAFLQYGIHLSIISLADLLAVGSGSFEKSLIHGLRDVRLDNVKLINCLLKHSGNTAYFSI